MGLLLAIVVIKFINVIPGQFFTVATLICLVKRYAVWRMGGLLRDQWW